MIASALWGVKLTHTPPQPMMSLPTHLWGKGQLFRTFGSMSLKILGIETSCDETAVGVVEDVMIKLHSWKRKGQR